MQPKVLLAKSVSVNRDRTLASSENYFKISKSKKINEKYVTKRLLCKMANTPNNGLQVGGPFYGSRKRAF